MTARTVVALTLILSFLSMSPAWAQQSVISPGDLRAAMAEKAEADEARRSQVLDVLQHESIRDLAASIGVDLSTAESAVATLDGQDLAAAATSANLIQNALAGEASTVTISLTTLLLIIIIVLLVA
jgi:hypothetical protein